MQVYDAECEVEDFEDWTEMENDSVCGDFGIMWFKMVGIVVLHFIVFSLMWILYLQNKEKVEI